MLLYTFSWTTEWTNFIDFFKNLSFTDPFVASCGNGYAYHFIDCTVELNNMPYFLYMLIGFESDFSIYPNLERNDITGVSYSTNWELVATAYANPYIEIKFLDYLFLEYKLKFIPLNVKLLTLAYSENFRTG